MRTQEKTEYCPLLSSARLLDSIKDTVKRLRKRHGEADIDYYPVQCALSR